MKLMLRSARMLIAVIIISAVNLIASQSVRVVSDLDGVEGAIHVSSDGQTTALEMALPAVAMNDVDLDGQTYQEVSLPPGEKYSLAETAEDGKPEVPAMTSLIAIPDHGGVALDVTYSGYDVISDIDLAPTQPSPLESGEAGDIPFTRDETVYGADAFYPGELAHAGEPAILRDVRLVQITLYPVQYNPVLRELRVYRDLSVSVNHTLENDVNPLAVRNRYISDGFYPIYKSLISNFDELFSTADVQRGGYVILTKQLFLDSLASLINWKHRKGYHVRVVPTTEINSNGNPTSAQIYAFLQNAYNTWEIPPEYVMIVGDRDNTSQTGIPDYPFVSDWTYTSDHHYTMLAGNDYLPDIFLSRLSVDNVSELRKALAKIMSYETDPYMGDPGYWLRGLSVAGNVYAVTPRLTVLWVRQLLLENGFTQVDTSFRWASNQSDPRLPSLFNQGVSIVSYRGWAGPGGWYSPSFNTSNLNALTNNNKLGIMASIVCGTGDFGDVNSDPCFGETWIRMGASTTSFKGGPSFFGATDHSTHTRWNNPIMVGYYWSIFRENNYHFASAAVRGKIQQYNTFPRHIDIGDEIEKYFHTYNMLGDPELDVRTKIPIPIFVSHPSTLPLGVNHIEITVADSQEHAVEGAFVTLVKGYGDNEEVFKVSKTDASGMTSMSFDALTTDTMFVTVSGRDLIPYRGFTLIAQSDVAVGYDSLMIDDDNAGYSSGNADGQVNPHETIELGVVVKNFGSSGMATNVRGRLEAIDPGLITVNDDSRSFGNLAPGQEGAADRPFVVTLNSDALDGDLARMKLSVTDASNDNWYSVIELPVASAKFRVSNVSFPGGNSRLDPGDSITMVLTLNNIGSVGAQGVAGRATTVDDYAAIYEALSDFGDIPVGGSASNSGQPMVVKCDSSAFDGRIINMVLDVTTSTGAHSMVPFAALVGSVQTSDPLGPDAYGYYMYDNTDAAYAEHPTYNWVEINPNLGGAGARLTFGGATDDKSELVRLPFDFEYYGTSHDYMIVCINGFVAFDSSRFDMAGNFWYNFFNWPIPDPGNAQGQISPFWDDLRFTGNNGVYIWDDTTGHRFIVEWSGCTNVNGGATETFEMIVMDPAYHPTITGDAEFYFQYNTINNSYDQEENYASVGFESPDELMGLEYTYDSDYPRAAATLVAGRAVKITTSTGRGGIRGTVDLQNGGFNQGATVRASSGQYRVTQESGEYWLRDLPPGEIAVSVSAAGYFPAEAETVTVTTDRTQPDVNFTLEACPVPANLTASDSLGDRIEITWDAVTHPDFTGYNIYRSQWSNGAFARLNTEPLTNTQFTDTSLPDSAVYWYYVTAAYVNGGWSDESAASVKDAGSYYNITGIGGDEAAAPARFFLAQNYPNPFNPSTSISYGLPSDSHVKLEVFNLLGQKVRTLIDGPQNAGYKTVVWDGRDAFGKSVASGVYFYRLNAGEHQDTRKMLMVK